MQLHRRRRSIGAALAAAAALLAVVPTPPAGAEDTVDPTSDPLTMVAIGDSQAAGPFVFNQNSWDCLRSDDNWPSVAAEAVGAELTDVTCSGATTSDLTNKRFGYIAPQLDAVTAEADIVTITIGANDLSLGTLVPSCFNPFPSPIGVSCKTWNKDDYDAKIAAVGERIAAAVETIHTKAPEARVFLVSYYQYWGKTGCYPIDPVWSVDAVWIQSIFDRLNAKLASVAGGHGASYVDLAGPSKDHGVCAPIGQKWVEGLVPTSDAMPYHPNRLGYEHGGAIVAAAIG